MFGLVLSASWAWVSLVQHPNHMRGKGIGALLILWSIGLQFTHSALRISENSKKKKSLNKWLPYTSKHNHHTLTTQDKQSQQQCTLIVYGGYLGLVIWVAGSTTINWHAHWTSMEILLSLFFGLFVLYISLLMVMSDD